MTDRRGFLGAGALLSLALADPAGVRRLVRLRSAFYPFALGIASGDPDPGGFVIWTRLAPEPLAGGGMPPAPVEVRWEVAADEAMSRVVARGTAAARPELAHSVHVEVTGLGPDRWYWYRFVAGGEASPVGRARTLPAAGAILDRYRFAFISCQHYEQGLYPALRHLSEEDLGLVLHLGDFIYEDGPAAGGARRHPTPEVVTLADYRDRYALYLGDPDLRAARAAAPWAVTWDDHEVDNNYASRFSERGDPPERFLARRAAAYQAFYEHQPLRQAGRPRGPDARIYRSLTVGSLARFNLLDTRQYRSDQACGDRQKAPCPAWAGPDRTVLGAAQERWLGERLGGRERWSVLAQQIFFSRLDGLRGPGEIFNMDSWNGYPAARQRLLDAVAARRRGDTVVLSGDVHASWAGEIRRDFQDLRSEPLGVELVGTSISSGGDGGEAIPGAAAILGENPHLKYHNARRGYVRCEITPDRWRADYRLVPYVSRPDPPIATAKSFLIERGRPRLADA